MMRIIVMGGSFNPPTKAHYRLMKNAVEALDANRGLFVPVSDAYLKRKMRGSERMFVLSPETRVKMLRSMCDDPHLDVCEKEIGTIEARTMPTLDELQSDYPEAELYFLMGADKLDLLRHLTEKRDFLNRYKVAVFSREEASIEDEFATDKILNPHLDRIVVLPQPKGVDGISSSLVRDRMLAGEEYQELLCPAVSEIFGRFTPADFPEVIWKFKDDYSFLANSFPCRIVWNGQIYNSADAAYKQCPKTDDPEIMESILEAKFSQNPNLMKKLSQTGNKLLLNGTNNKGYFWGIDVYSWHGENILGKILMKIREKETTK